MSSKAAEARAQAKAAAAADLGPTFTATWDDQAYTLRAQDMTALDVRELRRQTGYTWRTLLSACAGEFDVDLLSVIVWMARRVDGEGELTYEAVAGEMTWKAGYDIDYEAKGTPAVETDTDTGDALPEA